MCLLAVYYRACREAPILLAANREEYYARPSLPPSIQPGQPRVLCGLDARAGGTWLGVNEHGLVAAVTNRPKPRPQTAEPPTFRSRGLLCREMLAFASAAEALAFAREELASRSYDGANFACFDPAYAAVIHAGPRLEIIELPPGLHLLTAGDVDDPADARQALARRLFAQASVTSVGEFVSAARRVCSYGPTAEAPGIVLRHDGRGTVSSTIMALTERPSAALYLFAAGPPDEAPYEDRSELLRGLLGGVHDSFSPLGRGPG